MNALGTRSSLQDGLIDPVESPVWNGVGHEQACVCLIQESVDGPRVEDIRVVPRVLCRSLYEQSEGQFTLCDLSAFLRNAKLSETFALVIITWSRANVGITYFKIDIDTPGPCGPLQ